MMGKSDAFGGAKPRTSGRRTRPAAAEFATQLPQDLPTFTGGEDALRQVTDVQISGATTALSCSHDAAGSRPERVN